MVIYLVYILYIICTLTIPQWISVMVLAMVTKKYAAQLQSLTVMDVQCVH